MFDPPRPTQSKGIDAYKKTWPRCSPGCRAQEFSISELQVTAGDDVAFATASIHCSGTEANSEKVKLEVRLTIGLRKIGGRWTIVHAHHSEPSR